MTGQSESPELALIAQSIASANSKIRFFRVAYGRAPVGSSLAQPEIVSILNDYFKDSRVQLDWRTLREAQRRDTKLAFLAIQCLESALPYGGNIDIDLDGNEWVLRATGDKLHMVAEHWQILEGQSPEEQLGAAQVQFGMLAMLTQWRKPALGVSIHTNSITIRF
jgi:histidine phosphotransferase ChpT